MVVINIDTAKDSKEEIRKTIAYLQTLVEEESSDFSSLFGEEAPAPPAAGGVMGMFDNPLRPDPGPSEKPLRPGDDAESLLAAVDPADERSADDDDTVEVVDEQEDAFIEIVEY